MSLVLDTSMSLAWCFLDERPESAVAVLTLVTDTGALVPALWHLEIANALQAAVRRGRISTTFRDETLIDLAALPIMVDNETDRHAWRGTLGLAERFDLILYDAAYLELPTGPDCRWHPWMSRYRRPLRRWVFASSEGSRNCSKTGARIPRRRLASKHAGRKNFLRYCHATRPQPHSGFPTAICSGMRWRTAAASINPRRRIE